MISNHHYDQLSAIRDRYSNKRTLGYGLVDECMQLVESAIAENDARAAGRLEHAEKIIEQHRGTIDSLRDKVREWEASHAALRGQLEEKRALRESRAQQGEEVKVTIDRSLGGWVVADLEEIAYRFRCGGAVDDTNVRMTDYSATALVLAPNMVPLDRPTRGQLDDHDYTADDGVQREPDGTDRSLSRRAKIAGGGAILALVVDVLVRVLV